MAKTKEQKKKVVEQLKENITKQKAMVFVAVEGLKASDIFDLRKRLKAEDCLLQVVKKTLLDIAFKGSKLKIEGAKLQGQVALIFGFNDEFAPAKIASNFSKEKENLKILGGYFENEFREKEEILSLAQIPSREQLLAKLVGSLSAPASNFVNVLQGNIKGLINVLAKAKTIKS